MIIVTILGNWSHRMRVHWWLNRDFIHRDHVLWCSNNKSCLIHIVFCGILWVVVLFGGSYIGEMNEGERKWERHKNNKSKSMQMFNFPRRDSEDSQREFPFPLPLYSIDIQSWRTLRSILQLSSSHGESCSWGEEYSGEETGQWLLPPNPPSSFPLIPSIPGFLPSQSIPQLHALTERHCKMQWDVLIHPFTIWSMISSILLIFDLFSSSDLWSLFSLSCNPSISKLVMQFHTKR